MLKQQHAGSVSRRPTGAGQGEIRRELQLASLFPVFASALLTGPQTPGHHTPPTDNTLYTVYSTLITAESCVLEWRAMDQAHHVFVLRYKNNTCGIL